MVWYFTKFLFITKDTFSKLVRFDYKYFVFFTHRNMYTWNSRTSYWVNSVIQSCKKLLFYLILEMIQWHKDFEKKYILECLKHFFLNFRDAASGPRYYKIIKTYYKKYLLPHYTFVSPYPQHHWRDMSSKCFLEHH